MDYMLEKVFILENKQIRHALSAPFIFSMIVPLVILDLFMEIYQHISFPLYGIELVKRREYIKMDRHRLGYLNPLEKVFCAYCGYANGLMAYGVEIAGRTERYWCAVKHKPDPNFHEPEHHQEFTDYDDEEGYRRNKLN